MSDENSPADPDLALSTRQLSRIAALFADRLTALGAEGDGTLGPDQIAQVLRAFRTVHDPGIAALYAEIWATLGAATAEAYWSKRRTLAMERLIVSRFESLLAPRGQRAQPGRTISRRAIPGFIAALHQMIGPEMLETYEERVRELIVAERVRHGDSQLWRALPETPVGRTLVNDILVFVARHFTNMPKRRGWLIDQIGRNLTPATADIEAAAHFADREFHMVLHRLYAPLGALMADAQARDGLVKRYGEANVALVAEVLDALKRDREDTGIPDSALV